MGTQKIKVHPYFSKIITGKNAEITVTIQGMRKTPS
jgi:hypothetical protein